MDENARNALIEQLAESQEQTVNAVSRMTAQVVELGQRVDEIGARLDEAQKINHDTAGRVEQLASALDRADSLRLAEQVQALRNAQTQAEDRLGKMIAEGPQVERMKATMAQLRTELAMSLGESEQRLRSELENRTKQRKEEARRDAQAFEELVNRVDALVTTQAEARLKSEQRLESRFAGLQERMRVADEEMERWREQALSHEETARRAEVASAELKAEGERLKTAHHATVEAQRVAEASLNLTLDTLRQEIDARWEKNALERANGEQELARNLESRAQAKRQAIVERVEQVEAALTALDETVQAGFEIGSRDLTDLKHRLGLFIRGLRDASAEAGDALVTQLPSDDPGALGPERRQALRRALRARRAAGGS